MSAEAQKPQSVSPQPADFDSARRYATTHTGSGLSYRLMTEPQGSPPHAMLKTRMES